MVFCVVYCASTYYVLVVSKGAWPIALPFDCPDYLALARPLLLCSYNKLNRVSKGTHCLKDPETITSGDEDRMILCLTVSAEVRFGVGRIEEIDSNKDYWVEYKERRDQSFN